MRKETDNIKKTKKKQEAGRSENGQSHDGWNIDIDTDPDPAAGSGRYSGILRAVQDYFLLSAEEETGTGKAAGEPDVCTVDRAA